MKSVRTALGVGITTQGELTESFKGVMEEAEEQARKWAAAKEAGAEAGAEAEEAKLMKNQDPYKLLLQIDLFYKAIKNCCPPQ